MTDLATYLAAHPTLTDAEMDHAAALAMGWFLSGGEQPAWWVIPGGLKPWPRVTDWRPSADPAQALEFAQATADALGEVVTLYLLPSGNASAGLTLDLDREDGLVVCESAGPSPARALTAACLDAWRAREGV